MTVMGDEPELSLGDTGEYVSRVQDQLRGLQLLADAPDGAFGSSTEDAVRRLQDLVGHTPDGRVGPQTWLALAEQLQLAGLQYQPLAGAGNQEWDQEDQPDQPVLLSDDGRWRWDGEQWQPVGDEPPVIPHIDDIHPNIANDERFSTFHDFLREQHA